jgi:hypothetical protein
MTNKASKTATKTPEQKAADAQARKDKAAAKAAGSTAPIVELPKGTGTQDAPRAASNPPPIPRSEEKEPKERILEDTLRLPEDKARWNYGESTDDTSTLLREQREIDASQQ